MKFKGGNMQLVHMEVCLGKKKGLKGYEGDMELADKLAQLVTEPLFPPCRSVTWKGYLLVV